MTNSRRLATLAETSPLDRSALTAAHASMGPDAPAGLRGHLSYLVVGQLIRWSPYRGTPLGNEAPMAGRPGGRELGFDRTGAPYALMSPIAPFVLH